MSIFPIYFFVISISNLAYNARINNICMFYTHEKPCDVYIIMSVNWKEIVIKILTHFLANVD